MLEIHSHTDPPPADFGQVASTGSASVILSLNSTHKNGARDGNKRRGMLTSELAMPAQDSIPRRQAETV